MWTMVYGSFPWRNEEVREFTQFALFQQDFQKLAG